MKKFFQFCRECVAELRKVSWPTFGEVISSVKVVIISLFVLAVLLGVMDFLFTGLYSFIFTGNFIK